MIQHLDVEVVLEAHAGLGEGPVWDERTSMLVWVDIMGNSVHCFDPTTCNDRAVDVGQPVGAAALRESRVVEKIDDASSESVRADDNLDAIATPLLRWEIAAVLSRGAPVARPLAVFDPARVAVDVADGKVSTEAARLEYGLCWRACRVVWTWPRSRPGGRAYSSSD